MPNKSINLQDVFLNQVRKENVGVVIHLTGLQTCYLHYQSDAAT